VNRRARAGCVALTLTTAAAHAYAQPPARIEVAAGVAWLGSASFGSRDATETTGTGGSFRLFSTASELTSASGLTARVTVPVLARIELEASGAYVRLDIRTHVTSDVETSNAPVDAVAHAQQFTIGGAALWSPGKQVLGPRAAVFLRVGAALERRLEDDRRRIVDGPAIEVGGGVRYLLASKTSGWWRGVGARGDVMALVRGAALALDARAHVSPALGAAVYVRF
jgi:hypothetical protein